jgi:hypothetical protein
MVEFQLITLLVVANAAPILARKLLRKRWSRAIDGGMVFGDGIVVGDGRPLLGPSKTWRGLIAGILAGSSAGMLLGFGGWVSFGLATLTMLGDLLSSFCKRRLHIEASGKATGLDQIPESLLPALAGMFWLHYGWDTLIMVVLGFCLFEMLISPLLFFLGIRRRPY